MVLQHELNLHKWACEYSVIHELFICLLQPHYDATSCTTTQTAPYNNFNAIKRPSAEEDKYKPIKHSSLHIKYMYTMWIESVWGRLWIFCGMFSYCSLVMILLWVTSCKNHFNSTATTSMIIKTVRSKPTKHTSFHIKYLSVTHGHSIIIWVNISWIKSKKEYKSHKTVYNSEKALETIAKCCRKSPMVHRTF